MKKLIFTLRILLSLLVVAFFLLAPPKLQAVLGRNPYREFLSGKAQEGYKGILTIWHVVGFKPYQGSVSAFLEGCAAQYEKEHGGVYIEVIGMPLADMQERMARGEQPDLYSLPLHELQSVNFAPMRVEKPALSEGLYTYEQEGALLALPFLYSGYFIIGNTMLYQNLGLQFPNADARDALMRGDASLFQSVLQEAISSRATQRFGGLVAPPLLAAQLGLSGEYGTDGDFKAGQVPFLIGDARACGDYMRKLESGGFTFDALPLGGFTDLVQYIGINSQSPQERHFHAQGFIDMLLTSERQSKLTALGALPVIAYEHAPSYTDSMLLFQYEAYKHAITPEPAIFSSQKDMILSDATAAAAGDEAAMTSFRSRMRSCNILSFLPNHE